MDSWKNNIFAIFFQPSNFFLREEGGFSWSHIAFGKDERDGGKKCIRGKDDVKLGTKFSRDYFIEIIEKWKKLSR